MSMNEPLKILALAVLGYVMGFLAAMPVGATQLEIARRSLAGYRASALMVVVGSVLSDTMYGVIAFFGIAPYLHDRAIVLAFWIVNACILVVLGVWSIRQSRHPLAMDELTGRMLPKRNVAFVTGFSLAVTNPLMVVWWLLGSQFLGKIGLIKHLRTPQAIEFLMAGALGIGSYLALLALGVHRAKRFLSARAVQWIIGGFGVALIGLATYSLVQSALLVFD